MRWSQPTLMSTIQPTIIALEKESFYQSLNLFNKTKLDMIMVDLILMSLYNLSYFLAFSATMSQLIIARYIGTYVPQTQLL
jgi:hypothetical protein